MNSEIRTTDYFNRVIGLIEDIVVSEEFQNLQHDFMEKHYAIFEYEEENKIEYTPIFNGYTEIMESFIVDQLNRSMENETFDMDRFASELKTMKGVLDGEIFELLFSLSDFLTFKEMMLDYRSFKEGATNDMSDTIMVMRIRSCEDLRMDIID